ncbi:hypothetical protein [Bacteroides gallinarum]|uniref:hypothetical protein n=2 Tax=Bacteroides gallinarum TaxID=376806 RepID=UPI00036118BF|nr:hypothetical protein [Bacteroides gallinarum]
MNRDIEEIRHAIHRRQGGDTVFQAVVTEVDEKEFTCTVRRDGQVDYFDVRLRALVDSKLQGFAFIPRLQSTVLVCRIGNSNELFVCRFGEIDGIVLTAGDTELKAGPDNIDIRKGDKVSVHIDADRLEVTNGQTKVTHEAEALTLLSDRTTVRITTGGLTLKKGGSGLKKTLGDLLTAIQKLTVTTGVGPSGPPINITDFQKVQQDLSNYLED